MLNEDSTGADLVVRLVACRTAEDVDALIRELRTFSTCGEENVRAVIGFLNDPHRSRLEKLLYG